MDVRIVAATNKNLLEEVKKGNFREDLYYRLNVVPIHLPPLRERREDLEDLIQFFLGNSANISGISNPKIMSAEALDSMTKYGWPGNIRELENIVERCVVISSNSMIKISCLPYEIREAGNSYAPTNEPEPLLNSAIDAIEHEVIQKALAEANGNKTKASLALGISRRSLHRKLQKYEMPD